MTSRSPDPVPCARPGRIRSVLGGLAVAALLSAGGCARPQADPALQVIRSYQQALVRDDAQAAYALLSPSLQQGLPREQFEQLWQQQRPERIEQARQLGQLIDKKDGKLGRPSALSARALLTLPQGTQLAVVPAGNAWRVAEPDLQQVRARTPEEALQLLLLAVEQRSYPALLRLLSASERQALEAELRERAERLRSTLSKGQSVDVSGDRARLQYDPRFFIDLKREPEGWRVIDFN